MLIKPITNNPKSFILEILSYLIDRVHPHRQEGVG
jgi:hypothetical protein